MTDKVSSDFAGYVEELRSALSFFKPVLENTIAGLDPQKVQQIQKRIFNIVFKAGVSVSTPLFFRISGTKFFHSRERRSVISTGSSRSG